jgi:hypothetical protein
MVERDRPQMSGTRPTLAKAGAIAIEIEICARFYT